MVHAAEHRSNLGFFGSISIRSCGAESGLPMLPLNGVVRGLASGVSPIRSISKKSPAFFFFFLFYAPGPSLRGSRQNPPHARDRLGAEEEVAAYAVRSYLSGRV